MNERIRVLLVDDHRLVRAGFELILEAEDDIEVVGEAADGAEAVARVTELAPDVVCMDVQMPVLDGIEATRRIVAEHPRGVRVLMLTTFRDDDNVRASLAAGASGFVLKNSPPETLVEAIRVVHRGDALLDPQVTRAVIAAAARVPGQASDAGGAAAAAPDARGAAARGTDAPAHAGGAAAGSPVAGDAGPLAAAHAAPGGITRDAPGLERLTEREREVLLLLAEGLSNADIAARMFVSAATIKTHVSNLLAKLGVHDRLHAVIYAYEHGLVGGGETSSG